MNQSGDPAPSEYDHHGNTLLIHAIPPFDLIRTVAVLRRRASHVAEVVDGGQYQRLANLGAGDRIIATRQVAEDTLQVEALDGPLSRTEAATATTLLTRTLGLSVDLRTIYPALDAIPALAEIARKYPGIKPPRFDSLWTTILSVVPFQQVSLDAGMAILNRLIRTCSTPTTYAHRDYYPYPSAEAVRDASTDVLRACGLSRAKITSLQTIARILADGTLTDQDISQLNDREALARLVALPGIGIWSGQVILLRGFRRLSMFPTGDSGVARNLLNLARRTPDNMPVDEAQILAHLGDVRGYAYFLLLAWKMWSGTAEKAG